MSSEGGVDFDTLLVLQVFSIVLTFLLNVDAIRRLVFKNKKDPDKMYDMVEIMSETFMPVAEAVDDIQSIVSRRNPDTGRLSIDGAAPASVEGLKITLANIRKDLMDIKAPLLGIEAIVSRKSDSRYVIDGPTRRERSKLKSIAFNVKQLLKHFDLNPESLS